MAVLDASRPSEEGVDPTTLANAKRVALARLTEVRERVADFLSHPTT